VPDRQLARSTLIREVTDDITKLLTCSRRCRSSLALGCADLQRWSLTFCLRVGVRIRRTVAIGQQYKSLSRYIQFMGLGHYIARTSVARLPRIANAGASTGSSHRRQPNKSSYFNSGESILVYNDLLRHKCVIHCGTKAFPDASCRGKRNCLA
jgi:hypothetical protein